MVGKTGRGKGRNGLEWKRGRGEGGRVLALERGRGELGKGRGKGMKGLAWEREGWGREEGRLHEKEFRGRLT